MCTGASHKLIASSQPRPAQSHSHTVAFQAARPYVPPKDFAPVSTGRASSFQNTAVLDNLEGKQVWHITAPADLSLKALKDLAMEQAMRGEAVISYKGSDYGFSPAEKEEAGERAVVIPRQDGYKAGQYKRKNLCDVFNAMQYLPEYLKVSTSDKLSTSLSSARSRPTQTQAPRPQRPSLDQLSVPRDRKSKA